jgi:putative peptide zinc metalloprotease protein
MEGLAAMTDTVAPGALSIDRLAQGVELLGRYEQSGYTAEQYLLRRPDGQVVQLTQLLYFVVEALRDTTSAQAAADHASASFGRTVSAENVEYLIEHKLRPLGIFEGDVEFAPPAGGSQSAATAQSSTALSLTVRRAVIPASVHRRLTFALRWLFDRRVIPVVLLALVAADAWMLVRARGNVLGGTTEILSHPGLLLALFGLFALCNAFHEFGHAAGTAYSGAKPGVMGIGIYLVMPVFFTDVTDSYRLDRRGRLRVDLGGVYFNAIAVLAAVAVYLPTHYKPLLLLAVLLQMEALFQFLPFVRLDGYYVVADLIGIANPFAFVKPALARLLRRPEPAGPAKLSALKPGAQRAIKIWVALTVPILAAELALTGVMAPTVAPAFWRSVTTNADTLSRSVSHGHIVPALAAVADLALLAITPLGIALLLGSLALGSVRMTRRALAGRRTRRDAAGQAGRGAAEAQAAFGRPADVTPLQAEQQQSPAGGLTNGAAAAAGSAPAVEPSQGPAAYAMPYAEKRSGGAQNGLGGGVAAGAGVNLALPSSPALAGQLAEAPAQTFESRNHVARTSAGVAVGVAAAAWLAHTTRTKPGS